MSFVIFSIDNVSDTHTLAKFLRHIDTQSAMQKMRGKMAHCVGMWEGVLEPSFIMTLQDFNDHVKPHGFVDNQVCVMECLGKDDRQPCDLVYRDGKRENKGRLVNVDAEEAMRHKGWTYRLDTGLYYVTK